MQRCNLTSKNSRLDHFGVDLIALIDSCSHRPTSQRFLAERISLHLVFFVTGGTGSHTIDCVDYPVKKGSLIHVRPGQVHQWHIDHALEGYILVFEPSAINESAIVENWPACRQLSLSLQRSLIQALEQLSQDLNSLDSSKLDIALIHHGLIYLLLRISRWCNTKPVGTQIPPPKHQIIYKLFVDELEVNFRNRLRVQTYAHKLGYSESTLSRACLFAKGESVKVIIDRRVALEAQRLLTQGKQSVSQIGYQLGFSELTNFVKFLNRLVGMTPTAFRIHRSSVC